MRVQALTISDEGGYGQERAEDVGQAGAEGVGVRRDALWWPRVKAEQHGQVR
jgi:hypothetical protein